MQLRFHSYSLRFAHTWSISRSVASGGRTSSEVVFVELEDKDGLLGIGEAAPSARYNETCDTVLGFLASVDPSHLSFERVEESMAYLDELAQKDFAAKAAINLALLDGAAKKAGLAVFDFLKLGFTEHRHVTSFSIGIDQPEVIEKKVLAAHSYPVLKVKVGGPGDKATIRVVREIVPEKQIRVDANEAWLTKERALSEIEALRIMATLNLSNSRCPQASRQAPGYGCASGLLFLFLPMNPTETQMIFLAALIALTA